MELEEIPRDARIGVFIDLARSGRVVQRPGPALSEFPFIDRQPFEVGRYVYLFDVGGAHMYRTVIPEPPSPSWAPITSPVREVAPIDSVRARLWYGQQTAPLIETAERLGASIEQARGDLDWWAGQYNQWNLTYGENYYYSSPAGLIVGIISGVDHAILDFANDLARIPASLAALPQALRDLKEQLSQVAPELMREAREHPVEFVLMLEGLRMRITTEALDIPKIVQLTQNGISEVQRGHNGLATQFFTRAAIKILNLIFLIRDLVAAIRRAPQMVERVTARLEEIGNNIRALRGEVQSGEVLRALEHPSPPTAHVPHQAPNAGSPATQEHAPPPPAPVAATGTQSIRERVRRLQNRLLQRLRIAYARQQVEQLLARIPPPRIGELLEKARRRLSNYRSTNAATHAAAVSGVKGPLFEMAVTTMPWHSLYRTRARMVLRRINRAARLFDEASIRFITGIRTVDGREFTDGIWVAFSHDRRRMLILDVYESKSAQNWRDLIGQFLRDRERLTETRALRIPSEAVDNVTRGAHRAVAQGQSTVVEIDRTNISLASDHGERLNWTALIPRHLEREQSVSTALSRLQRRGHPGPSIRDALEERLRELGVDVTVRENPLENDVAETVVDELFRMAAEPVGAAASSSNP